MSLAAFPPTQTPLTLSVVSSCHSQNRTIFSRLINFGQQKFSKAYKYHKMSPLLQPQGMLGLSKTHNLPGEVKHQPYFLLWWAGKAVVTIGMFWIQLCVWAFADTLFPITAPPAPAGLAHGPQNWWLDALARALNTPPLSPGWCVQLPENINLNVICGFTSASDKGLCSWHWPLTVEVLIFLRLPCSLFLKGLGMDYWRYRESN